MKGHNVYDFSAEQPEEIQSTLQRQLGRKIKKKKHPLL
jgi:hypothetical protein